MSAAAFALLMIVPQVAPDTVVVCPPEFREAMKPWLEYRLAEGHNIQLIDSTTTRQEIRRQIREIATGGKLRHVLLVGDADPRMLLDRRVWQRSVPTHHAQAEVNVRWGSPVHIGTDNYYADLDGDTSPELAVGRLPADTEAELKQIVAKILAYERSTDFGPWRRRVNFVAGIGGFGSLADRVIESSTSYFLTHGIPPDYRLSMTYANWRSPYCPDPRLFHATTAWRLNQGAWLWVYIGHGMNVALDRLRTPEGQYHILAKPDVARLDCRRGPPIAVFLACYTGAFDATQDCLAEEMLLHPNGPVAVLAGSRVTMPYGMAVMASGLMDECFRRRPKTLGEAILHAKQSMMAEPAADDQWRLMLDTIAMTISPEARRLPQERAEHVLLFNLLGDPLLRLRYPKEITLDVPSTVSAGGQLRLTGDCPIEGQGIAEIVVRRNRLTFKSPPRRDYPKDSDTLSEFQNTYYRANNRRLCAVPLTLSGGRFEAKLDVPASASGVCHVRVFIEGQDAFATGAANVKIQQGIDYLQLTSPPRTRTTK